MIKIGELSIDKLYIGELEVGKMYLGENLVYSGVDPTTKDFLGLRSAHPTSSVYFIPRADTKATIYYSYDK